MYFISNSAPWNHQFRPKTKISFASRTGSGFGTSFFLMKQKQRPLSSLDKVQVSSDDFASSAKVRMGVCPERSSFWGLSSNKYNWNVEDQINRLMHQSIKYLKVAVSSFPMRSSHNANLNHKFLFTKIDHQPLFWFTLRMIQLSFCNITIDCIFCMMFIC